MRIGGRTIGGRTIRRPEVDLRAILVACAAVLFVAAVAAGSLTYYSWWSDRQADRARTDAVAAAQRTLEAMFSYDYRTVETELPKAVDDLDGSFKSDYLKIIKESIIPGAKEKQLTVQATVSAAGVVSAKRDHAVILAYLNQVTTGKDSPQGNLTASRVRVIMAKHGGHWLADQVTPI
jgi:Mce-associated membrane protein